MSNRSDRSLSPTQQCHRCHYNARSQFLVCALHPTGPEDRSCPDFKAWRFPSRNARHDALLAGQLPAPSNAFEAEWMQFWGPTDEEWLAVWETEDLPPRE